jgi:hypothetical protein
VSGVEEFGDLLFSVRARSLLARGRRWARPMTAGQIMEQARLTPDGSPAAVSAPRAVERMIWFEQRFGGLRYTILGDRENGMEYGLDGDCTVSGPDPAWRSRASSTERGPGRSTSWTMAAR